MWRQITEALRSFYFGGGWCNTAGAFGGDPVDLSIGLLVW